MKAQRHQKAPPLTVAAWVQGSAIDLEQLLGRVVLIEVFQVNCPGCFLYALPQAVALHHRYAHQGLTVLGIATAFEDYTINTLANLTRLAATGEVPGQTLLALQQQGLLQDGRLSYNIPFPLAMDHIQTPQSQLPPAVVDDFISQRVPTFSQQPPAQQQQLRENAERYLHSLNTHAETFERYDLQGTPSVLLIDKQGLLRERVLGTYPDLEARIVALLQE